MESCISKLQTICNKYLNVPAQDEFKYEPIMPYVIMTASNMKIFSFFEQYYAGLRDKQDYKQSS